MIPTLDNACKVSQGFFATIEECLCIPTDPLAAEWVPCPNCFPRRTSAKMMVEGEGFYCPTCEHTWDDDELREAIDSAEAAA